MGKPRRTFTRQFKAEAVKLVTEQRRSFAEAAANLGIAQSLLRKGNKDRHDPDAQAFPGKGNLPTLQEQRRRWRAENKRLPMERDMLKKMEMAVSRRLPGEGLVAHSDRGSQYARDHSQRLLERHGITWSMSRRGDCWDNAAMESFLPG